MTLFEEDKLAQLGLKKYDFLSLKETLGFVSDIKSLRFLPEVKGIIKVKLPSYQEVDSHDKKTWELLTNFCLTGIFQLDTPVARNLFIRFRPQNFSQLILFLALNRPGARKKTKEIIQKKNSPAKSLFASPMLREILAETYDFIVFEEQISQILVLIYGCSFAEAEIKRREIAEKGLEKSFLTEARQKLSRSDSELVYQQITSARGYTFNKAHAVAYGYLTYYIAYLKANFFSEFITYFLNEKKEKTLSYLQEAFFYNFSIKQPDINYSQINWSRKKNDLIMGFESLKKYQANFFSTLLSEREKNGTYPTWKNLLFRTSELWKKVEIANFVEWAKSGLFASLQVDVTTLEENSTAIFRYLQLHQKIATDNSNDLPFLDLPTKLENKENKEIINQREWESLGCYISFFSRWKALAQSKELTSLLSIFRKYNNQEVLFNIYAIISQIEKKSEDTWILSLQDIRSSFKLEISASAYQKNQEKLVIHNELLFICQINAGWKIDYVNLERVLEL